MGSVPFVRDGQRDLLSQELNRANLIVTPLKRHNLLRDGGVFSEVRGGPGRPLLAGAQQGNQSVTLLESRAGRRKGIFRWLSAGFCASPTFAFHDGINHVLLNEFTR